MKVGIIGTGNMGRILIEAFIDGKALSPSSLFITNRTLLKAMNIKVCYPDINVMVNGAEVAKQTRLVFICVKPKEVFTVLKEISPFLTKDHCVVSITSPISVEQLESILPCSAARVIPSITNRALAGVSLITFGSRCEENERKKITGLFGKISTPVFISEEITRAASDIVSCGPAFFTFLARKFIHACAEETAIDEETAAKLTSEMLIGLGELLKKEYYTLASLQEKVCVQGGVTGVGINVLNEKVGDAFHHLFRATQQKFAEDRRETKKLLHYYHSFSNEKILQKDEKK